MSNNFILFTNSFLSYLLCFVVFTAAVIVAVLIGINVRKAKNAKELETAGEEAKTE